MDLKAFKGLPHEFGGIDYTEGSEVEGGEFAVNIGKSGNEYIFDKNSSEGEKLSKEYKRLDMNGRLSEDDPLSLETFDQIAREEALKHAQRSVNEKGIDPFRNMYDQGGQAANGGVKYAAGGAKNMYFTGGGMGNFGSTMGGIGGGFNMIGDLFKTPDVNFDAMFTPDADPMFANPQKYNQILQNPDILRNKWLNSKRETSDIQQFKSGIDNSDPLIENTAPANTQLMTEVGGLQSSVAPGYDIANIQQFKSGIDDAELEEENEKKKKIEQGISAGAGIGSMIGGLVRGDSKAGQLKEPVSFRDPGDERSRSKGPEFYKMEGKDYAASHLEGAASGAMTGLQTAGPWGALAGAVIGGVFKPISDKVNEDKIQKEATEQFNRKLKEGSDEGVRQSMMNAIAMDVDGTALIDKDRYAGVMRHGGAKKGVYGYYANGGGKKKEELLTGPTGPTSNASATGIAVSPTGAAYSSDQMSLDNRGVGSSDYGVIPANLEQYARTFFGSNKQFTEKDMTPEEYKALVDLYNIRKESNTIGYSDHDKVGSTNTSKAGMVSKLTNEPDIIRNLIGKAAVKDGYITSDYNFGNKPLSKILKNLNAEDLMAWAHNNSPFVDSEAMAKKDAIKIKMPKNRK